MDHPPSGMQPYDTDTLDALMLFHAPPPTPPYYPIHAANLQRRHEAVVRERNQETRRAMHREVQRRFVKRKQAEFAALRRRAQKLELRHRTLLLRAETDKLSEERVWLVRKCRAQDIQVEGDDEDNEEETEEGVDDGTIKREGREPRVTWSHKIFQFDLSGAGASE